MPLTPEEQIEFDNTERALVLTMRSINTSQERPIRGAAFRARIRNGRAFLGEPVRLQISAPMRETNHTGVAPATAALGARMILAEPELEGALRLEAERLYVRRGELIRLRDNPDRGKQLRGRGVCAECARDVAVYGPKNLASHHNHLYKDGKCPGSRRQVHRLFVDGQA